MSTAKRSVNSLPLSVVIGPLMSQAAEIPYSEFKTKLAAGQLVDVTVGPTVDGVMTNSAAKAPDQATTRFFSLMPPGGDERSLEAGR